MSSLGRLDTGWGLGSAQPQHVVQRDERRHQHRDLELDPWAPDGKRGRSYLLELCSLADEEIFDRPIVGLEHTMQIQQK